MISFSVKKIVHKIQILSFIHFTIYLYYKSYSSDSSLS